MATSQLHAGRLSLPFLELKCLFKHQVQCIGALRERPIWDASDVLLHKGDGSRGFEVGDEKVALCLYDIHVTELIGQSSQIDQETIEPTERWFARTLRSQHSPLSLYRLYPREQFHGGAPIPTCLTRLAAGVELQTRDNLTKSARTYILFGEHGGGPPATVFSRIYFMRASMPCDLSGANEIVSAKQ